MCEGHVAGHLALQSVSWHAHGGTPVLNGFWVPCFGSEVVITAALDGSLRLWTVSGLLSRADPSANRTGMDVSAPASHCMPLSSSLELVVYAICSIIVTRACCRIQ